MQFWDCRQVHQKKLLSMLRTLPTPDPGSASSESHRVECEHALSQGVWRREPVGLAQQVSRDSFPASFVYSFLCPFLPSFSNHSHILPSFSSHPLIHSVGNSILPSFLHFFVFPCVLHSLSSSMNPFYVISFRLNSCHLTKSFCMSLGSIPFPLFPSAKVKHKTIYLQTL